MTHRPPLRIAATVVTAAIITACAGTAPDEREAQLPADNDGALLIVGEAPVAPGRVRAADAVTTEAREESLSFGDQAAHKALSRQAYANGNPASAVLHACCPTAPVEPVDRENYGEIQTNPVRLASEHPMSTFSIDVDTGSYANVRRFLTEGRLPPDDAVRVEELINYFSYAYPTPRSTEAPFNVITELAQTPWNDDTLLLHVGLKGFEIDAADRPPANLVFLVDVSGSMQSANKLPLLKDALRMLTRDLDARDSVAIAGYAGGAGLILEPTSGEHRHEIAGALDSLQAAGRTNGAAGIHLAYELAHRGFIEGGINRVIIATDGDFNVGTVDFEALIDLVEDKREHGVALTALGFGTGNYNDHLLEQLADAGNGNYAYIDSRREARKVLVEEMSSTLQTIAKDVKIQVEFNPDVVAEYRLIGYENRMLRREDFNNDRIDAGEIGAGHTVTALYEVTLVDSPARLVEPLRYGNDKPARHTRAAELAFVKLRYKHPEAESSTLIERAVTRRMLRAMDDDFAFASAVAAFGQRLRGGEYLAGFDFADIGQLAEGATGRDGHGYRDEFLGLVERAAMLSEPLAATQVRDDRIRVAQ